MGAQEFDHFCPIKTGDETLDKVFHALVEQALWDHGHAGYSGTVAEKDCVELRNSKVYTIKEAEEFAYDDMDNNDKWGCAFALQINDPEYGKGWYIYGLASS